MEKLPAVVYIHPVRYNIKTYEKMIDFNLFISRGESAYGFRDVAPEVSKQSQIQAETGGCGFELRKLSKNIFSFCTIKG
ncbi:MAG: hypothetical protein R6V04_13755 [bacterium]